MKGRRVPPRQRMVQKQQFVAFRGTMKGRRVPPRQQPTADECDRIYFEQHPDATEYIRAYESGEFPIEFFAPPGHTVLMRVTQLTPGIRSRKPFLSKIGVAA